MKRKKSDILLDLIIVALTVLMLALMLMYASSRATGQKTDTEVFDKLWIVQDYDDTAFSVFDISLCTPELIAYKQHGKPAGAVYANEELVSRLYSVLSDVIHDVFGSKSTCISEDIDYSQAVRELVTSDSYIFFEYSAAVPFPYIYALASEQSSVDVKMCASGKAAYISKLALVLSKDENGTESYKAIAFDNDNNAYRFKRVDSLEYSLPESDKIHLDAYASSFSKFEFLANITDSELVSTEYIYGTLSYSPLQPNAGTGFLGLDHDITSAAFLELFELNPEKLNSYVERDGTKVYIGTDERLTISPDKIIEYTSSEAIPLNKVLGYTPSAKSSYSLFDMLKATDILINRFTSAYPEHIGKSVDIKLTNVFKDAASGGKPVFEYSYFYDGIKIETPCAFRFVFTSDGICELRINAEGFTVMTEKHITLSKSVVLDRITATLPDITGVRPIYTQSENGHYTLEWAAYR